MGNVHHALNFQSHWNFGATLTFLIPNTNNQVRMILNNARRLFPVANIIRLALMLNRDHILANAGK